MIIVPKQENCAAILDVNLDTDMGGPMVALFHPHDLAHRKEADFAWSIDDGSVELAEGSLVAFMSGGDGRHTFRITNGNLAKEERGRILVSWDFRFVVRHNRVFLGGVDHLPNSMGPLKDAMDDTDPLVDHECWIEIANGNYRVTVHAIRFWNEPELDSLDHLPEYVIQFQPLDDLSCIRPARKPVLMLHDDGFTIKDTDVGW